MTPYWQQVIHTLCCVLAVGVAVWGLCCALWITFWNGRER